MLVVHCVPPWATARVSAETYTPRTERWSATGSMTVPRLGHTAVTINTPAGLRVLVAGGAADRVRIGNIATVLASGRRRT
jgi:hypothetical protein